MGLGTFGVERLFRFVTSLKKKLSTTTIIFFILYMFLQAAFVGVILWVIMFVIHDFSFKNWIIVMVASVAAGIVSAVIDTKKIFSGKTNYTVAPLEEKDKTMLYCYVALFILYVGLDIVMGINLVGM